MGWKKTVGVWMLQICAMEIWPHCKCGYLYFYDTMMRMERALADTCLTPSNAEIFSLAAACLLQSFRALQPEDPGVLTLMHLVVHRLKRLERTHPGFEVTTSSILEQMQKVDTAYVPELATRDEEGTVKCEESMCESEQLHLKLLDLIEGKQNVGRPIVQTEHPGCWSQYLRITSRVIENDLLRRGSEAVVLRIMQGTATEQDRLLCHEAKMLCPHSQNILRDAYAGSNDETVEKAIKLVQQALTFQTMAVYCPWVFLASYTKTFGRNSNH